MEWYNTRDGNPTVPLDLLYNKEFLRPRHVSKRKRKKKEQVGRKSNPDIFQGTPYAFREACSRALLLEKKIKLNQHEREYYLSKLQAIVESHQGLHNLQPYGFSPESHPTTVPLPANSYTQRLRVSTNTCVQKDMYDREKNDYHQKSSTKNVSKYNKNNFTNFKKTLQPPGIAEQKLSHNQMKKNAPYDEEANTKHEIYKPVIKPLRKMMGKKPIGVSKDYQFSHLTPISKAEFGQGRLANIKKLRKPDIFRRNHNGRNPRNGGGFKLCVERIRNQMKKIHKLSNKNVDELPCLPVHEITKAISPQSRRLPEREDPYKYMTLKQNPSHSTNPVDLNDLKIWYPY